MELYSVFVTNIVTPLKYFAYNMNSKPFKTNNLNRRSHTSFIF